jgi:hypothetical protein
MAAVDLVNAVSGTACDRPSRLAKDLNQAVVACMDYGWNCSIWSVKTRCNPSESTSRELLRIFCACKKINAGCAMAGLRYAGQRGGG